MAEPESTVINTNVKQVKRSLQNMHPIISKASFEMPPLERTHHKPELWWPELLVPRFQQKWPVPGLLDTGPSEVCVISTWEEVAGLNLHLYGQDRCIRSHLNFGAAREKAAASIYM